MDAAVKAYLLDHDGSLHQESVDLRFKHTPSEP